MSKSANLDGERKGFLPREAEAIRSPRGRAPLGATRRLATCRGAEPRVIAGPRTGARPADLRALRGASAPKVPRPC